jgi:hypothetical protein
MASFAGTPPAMAKNHGPTVKNDKQYEALRDQGASKQKAARIANSDTKSTARKGGKHGKYEDWSKDDLEKQARKVGIEGRSKMNKGELAKALRNS